MQSRFFRNSFYVIGIILILASLFVVYTQSNLFNKVSGSEFNVKYIYESISDEADGGYIRLVRNSQTPGAYEWASFENGDKYTYFSILPSESSFERIYIDLPSVIDPKTYYIDVEIKYGDGTTDLSTVDFLVI